MRCPLLAAATLLTTLLTALLTALLAAPLQAQVAVDSGAHPIHLADAIRLAQRNAPAAVQARGQMQTSQAGLRSAYAAFIPSLSLNMSSAAHTPAGEPVNNPTTGQLLSGEWQLTQGISMGLDLFDGGRRLFNVSAARAQLGAAQAGELAQYYQIAYQVKQQYYAVLAARESQAAAHSQLAQAVEQLRVSVAKVRARTATKSDSLRALIQVGNAQLAMLTANNDLQAANAGLTRLIAAPATVTASAEDTVGEGVVDVDSVAIAKLASQGPSVQQAGASLDAARAGAQASRSTYYPSIVVSYGRSRVTPSTAFTLWGADGTYSGQLRFSLSYPIFNQWSREQSIVLADVVVHNADAALRDARYAAQQGLVQYLGALHTAQQQVGIQIVSVAAAEEDLRVQQERYQLGVSTILDVLTSQTTLTAARAALIQARFNYRVAKAQLEALVGRDL